jgi:hypothetical protein
MKKRNYIKVSYKWQGRQCSQDFKMSETRLINTVLKELADEQKCEVELIECSQEQYKILFG